MTSLSKKQQGFTIVELLIVIVVIGILAGLVLNTFNGVQKKARDQERRTDINALHGQLEAYYASEIKYPTLANVNDAAWRSDNMKGLDAEALRDPKGTTAALATAVSATQYGYVATPAGCDNVSTTCEGYTLQADLETDTTNYSKTDLNN